MTSKSKDVQRIVDKILKLDRVGAEEIFNKVRLQASSLHAVDTLIVPALEEIGGGWEKGTVALAQVYMGSKICEELITRFLPLAGPKYADQPRMAIALLDDYHALGKMIISASLRANGYELHDYGRVTAQELAQKVSDDSVRIILISTLMLRSALQIKEVKKLLTEAGSPARIIVGGAPFRFDPLLWEEVGADATGADAGEALKAVSSCIQEIMETEAGV